ncbi:MAG: redoxin domain-containing protein [Sedimentisphaerales bacterium]|nr:redoxin domain-containing protein [Sedimentisphaerales bacterium]
MSNNKKIQPPILSWIPIILSIYPIFIYAAESDKSKTIEDIKPPFTMSIITLTPDGKPQPGVKIKCIHPRSQRGAAIVDMVATSDEKGVAEFNITKADLVLDRYFWFSMADEDYVGNPGVGISPIDNEYTYTFKVLPAEKYQILVVDENDKPLSDAKLWLYSDHPEFPRLVPDMFRAAASATTNLQGLADVTFADIGVNIMAGAKDRASTLIRSEILPKDRPFVIKLSPGCNISGKVIDAENNPVENAELSAKKKDFIMNYSREFILNATTDAEGNFVLENASEGMYEIQSLMQEPHEALYAKPVSVTVDGNSDVAGVKITAEQGAILKGKYSTKHNLRISDREIFIATFSPERSNWEIKTKDDGSFSISGIPQNTHGMIDFIGVSGYYTSLTMSDTYPFFELENRGIRFRNVPPGVYEGVKVEFLFAGRATGTVFDSSGNPMPNQELVLRPGGWIHRTNDKGRYTAEIPPNVDVTIALRDSSSGQAIYYCEPFKIEEGQVIQKDIKIGEVSSKLAGKPLPEFEGIDIEFDARQAQGKKILVCFFDMDQRPSRFCVSQLAKQSDDLASRGIVIVAVHARNIEKKELDDWLGQNHISLPIGTIEEENGDLKSTWGAKSLPWLILTDWKHIVRAEGFNINELDSKIEESTALDVIEGHVMDTNGRPISGAEVRIDRDRSHYYPPNITQTDEQGYYCLHGVAWPYYILSQWKEPLTSVKGYRRQLMKLTNVFEGPQTIDFQFNPFPNENTIIHGKIVDNNKNPVSEYKVWIIDANDRESPDGVYTQKIDYSLEIDSEDGAFNLAGLPPRNYRLMIFPKSKNYEQTDFLNITLENEKTNELLIRLNSKKAFYGRVLFEDDSPAVLPETKTDITEQQSENSWMTLASLDKDGYFVLYLSDREIQEFESSGKQLWILLQKYHIGTFPFDQLAQKRSEAKIVKVMRPERPPDSIAALTGKSLPGFENIRIEFFPNQAKDKMILVYFWDMNQRPSRNCILQLSKKANELKENDVIIVVIQASKIEQARLDEWVKENNIPFPLGIIEGEIEKLKFNWGVKSLPWLILTDQQHIVQYEGFSINELDEKIKTFNEKK